MSKEKSKPGPERVKIDEDWEEAVKRALKKKRPEEGWPKPDDRKSGEESHSEDD